MESWQEYVGEGTALKWPYPIRYEVESEVTTDVLVLGGGIAGCWAAISVARKGLKVAIVEKAATVRSGAGGSGVDAWNYTANPCCRLSPEEMVACELTNNGGYTNALSRYIASREGYDTLLEYEKLGAKIRDTEDEFKGAPCRDEETKFVFSRDYENKLMFSVWGSGTKNSLPFKHAIYNECKRLGVEIYDRTQATSLLTEGGKQGARVVGATAVNVRTGEFTIFKAKAVVMCLSRPMRVWNFSTELSGLSTMRPHTCMGNGHAMAWRAGAELTEMERSRSSRAGTGDEVMVFGTGSSSGTWYACNMVDANGKEIPFVDANGRILESMAERFRPAPGQKFTGERGDVYEYRRQQLIPDLVERIKKGEFKLPLYADLPSMPESERKRNWGLLQGHEGKTRIGVLQTYTESGFDSSRDMLQSYIMIGGDMVPVRREGLLQQRTFGESGDAGGLATDWDLKTTLDGLYCAGDELFGGNYHHHAATTGRYAGRKAAEYAIQAAEPLIDREQVDAEKARVYAPTERKEGIEWKELNAGISRVMQNYCGDLKDENLLNIGLIWLKDIEDNEASRAYSDNPHKLGRTLDVLDLITNCQTIIHACLARKASSESLDFQRLDYPEMDPPEWHKWITVRLENGEVKIGELPIDFWAPLKENYEAHNRDYQGWYDSERK